ncbi:MAG: 2-oxoacid:ferredoxin oxidoreductase subunit beta [Desulfurococcales archaeon]|nr:2-oxoacid:ferredoxin oxidoreductase subunit beta [Desulfurococcales archaeon]
MARSFLEYKTDAWVQWCPGCGDFGILNSIHRALAELDIDPRDLVVIGGIGCSGRTTFYVKGSNLHALHGRAIPLATGVKLANPRLKVVIAGGDGDLLGIGAGHFVAVGRRNVDITIIVFDNAVYGLTKGQAAPTLPSGVKTKALPGPNIQDAVNPLLLALASGYTFIARGYAYHTAQLKELIKAAINHRGTALVDVLQPCPTYNNVMTNQWYEERIYYLDEEESWDPIVKTPEDYARKVPVIAAKMLEWGDRIPLGVFLKDETKKTFEERLEEQMPGYASNPPHSRPISIEGYPLADPWEVFKEKVVRKAKVSY